MRLKEEVDYRSDGTRIVRRPSRMTLARVSVLRGEGVKTGVPFIDDHIQTFEPITDYLTEYSGIRRELPSLSQSQLMILWAEISLLAGDLDHRTSPHTLVPLKVAYKKLRLLVDLGCRFIGHGLSKDFRIISCVLLSVFDFSNFPDTPTENPSDDSLIIPIQTFTSLPRRRLIQWICITFRLGNASSRSDCCHF